MKAIFIPHNFDPNKNLEKLNNDLKDAYSIKLDINLEYGGKILIVTTQSREDKLKKLNKISKNEKGTDNNSI